jgi:hypothetical protein
MQEKHSSHKGNIRGFALVASSAFYCAIGGDECCNVPINTLNKATGDFLNLTGKDRLAA